MHDVEGKDIGAVEELKMQKGERTDGLPLGRWRVECQVLQVMRDAS